MDLQTHDKRIKSPGEDCSKPVIVEKAGYIPRKQRIENLIDAGERLMQARSSGMFDYTEEPEGDYELDATRVRNFDPADASEILRGIKPKMSEELEKVPIEKVSDKKDAPEDKES